MRIDPWAEALFIAAILLLGGGLFYYGRVIRRILRLMGESQIWRFPHIGAVALLMGAGVHLYRMVGIFPGLSRAGPADLFDLIYRSLLFGGVENLLLLVAGGLCLWAGYSYYSQLRR